jgi:transposase-like protein
MARENREVWAKRVERWRDSGLTLKEFAAEVGVNANTLAGWRWRLGGGRRTGELPRSTPAGAAFIEIVAAPVEGKERSTPELEPRISTAVSEVEPIELILRGGQRIRVPARFDATALRRLVDALEAR